MAGLGGAALNGHLPALCRLADQGRLRLAAAADPAAASRHAFGQVAAGVPTFAGVEEMLSTVEVDALIVATDPRAHADLVQLGFAHGLHVVCEKPLVHTLDQQAALATAARRSPELALVSVHQYRHAGGWRFLAPAARLFNRIGLPFSIKVEVCRNGDEDPHAVSSWRGDPTGPVGLLADHGTHFVALAWTVDREMKVLGAGRRWEAPGLESSWGRVTFGRGTLDLHLSTLATCRRTTVRLDALGTRLEWGSGRLGLQLGRRRIGSVASDELSDRGYLDSLYLPFYDDFARELGDPTWRAARTAESLGVADVLVHLRERSL